MKLLIVMIIFFISTLAASQENNLSQLTLNECIQKAHVANPDLLILQETLNALTHREQSLFRDMLPNMALSWSGNEIYKKATDSYYMSIMISQPIFQGRSAYTNWKMAGLDIKRSKLGILRQQQLITLLVTNAWYELIQSQEFLIETIQALERLRQHASNAEHFFKEGWIWRTDVLEAKLQVARGEQALIVAENNVSRAKAKLNVLMHQDVNENLPVQGKLVWCHSDWTYEHAIQEALLHRPDLKQARIDIESNQASVIIEQSAYYPNVNANLSWSKSDNKIDMKQGVENRSFQLSASWTIWEWGKTNEQIAAAKSKIKSSYYQIEKIKDQIALEVHDAWLSVQEEDKKVKVLEQTLEQSDENYRVNIIRYRERLGTAKDVLDAQDLLTATKKDYIAALSSYLSSLSMLEYAIGNKSYDNQ